MSQQIITETEQKMEQSLSVLVKELSRIRTGRASLSLLEGIKIDYYGTLTPLSQVANLSVPESQTICIQAWDNSALPAIEKAILVSDLGLNPVNDGKIIRLPIPPLTEERRKEMVKVAKNVAESEKVTLRNIRREAIETIKQREKEKKVSADESFTLQDKIQKTTDKYIARCTEIVEKKEKEILGR